MIRLPRTRFNNFCKKIIIIMREDDVLSLCVVLRGDDVSSPLRKNNSATSLQLVEWDRGDVLWTFLANFFLLKLFSLPRKRFIRVCNKSYIVYFPLEFFRRKLSIQCQGHAYQLRRHQEKSQFTCHFYLLICFCSLSWRHHLTLIRTFPNGWRV